MRLLVLTCEALARATYEAAARSPHAVDITLNRRGLHDVPPDLRSLLQDQIDGAGPPHEAIALAYGLCGAATAGLTARSLPLVIPRAHDCITLFLGSRARYAEEVARTPGTYWYVRDYLERTYDGGPFGGVGAVSDAEARAMHAQYVEKYGADNADYLMEVLGAWREHYTRAAYVDMGIGDRDAEAEVEARARQEASSRGWTFDRLAGDYVLMRRLLGGDWDPADFLVLQPGERLAMSYDDGVVRAEPTG